ncbi:MAG TPA: hypothetical protein G4N95_00730 [Anaerolineae bacterium]|nr:hypothetical protein [Anaerolineae bacterium]
MNILEKLLKLVKPSPAERAYCIYVKCNYCGEVLKTRIDLYNELSIRFGDQGKRDSYFCRKTIIGSHGCYKPIDVELTFDLSRKLVSREIQGGEFVSEETYKEFVKHHLSRI